MSVQEILAAIDALSADERQRVYAELARKTHRQPEPQPSADDLARHLIGQGSGLHDVSTNKAYLDDLGHRSRS